MCSRARTNRGGSCVVSEKNLLVSEHRRRPPRVGSVQNNGAHFTMYARPRNSVSMSCACLRMNPFLISPLLGRDVLAAKRAVRGRRGRVQRTRVDLCGTYMYKNHDGVCRLPPTRLLASIYVSKLFYHSWYWFCSLRQLFVVERAFRVEGLQNLGSSTD